MNGGWSRRSALRRFAVPVSAALRRGAVERALAASGRSLDNATLEEMEALWQAVKKAEKAADS